MKRGQAGLFAGGERGQSCGEEGDKYISTKGDKLEEHIEIVAGEEGTNV